MAATTATPIWRASTGMGRAGQIATAVGYGLWATFSTPPDRTTAFTLAPVASPSGGGLFGQQSGVRRL